MHLTTVTNVVRRQNWRNQLQWWHWVVYRWKFESLQNSN